MSNSIIAQPVVFGKNDKISGIYKIYCSGNSKVYIGSSVSIRERWNSHKSYLSRNIHKNKHLQNTYNKYGANSFCFSIIEECDAAFLISREQYWIEVFKASTQEYGMNNAHVAENTTWGFKHSEETKKRLSELAKERDHSHLIKFKKGVPPHNKGKPGTPWTEEQRATASKARKGRKAWNKGVPHSEEAKRKISIAGKGRNRTISDEVYTEIKRLRVLGMSYPKIAKITGVSWGHCSRIANNNTGKYRKLKASVDQTKQRNSE